MEFAREAWSLPKASAGVSFNLQPLQPGEHVLLEGLAEDITP